MRSAPVYRWGIPLLMAIATGWPARAASPDQPDSVLAIRARRAAFEYQLTDPTVTTQVELWYTRDRGATWQRWGVHEDHRQALMFEAPAEGLYGFILLARDGDQATPAPPGPHTPAQRWVFIDYTPPLLQWDSVQPGDAFASRRIVHLRWTAHDNNLPGRCISLAYHSSLDQTWHTIDATLPNTGRYDWKVPAEVAGQITLKAVVRDLAGHVVERQYGPVDLGDWLKRAIPEAPPASRPAVVEAPDQPAGVRVLGRSGAAATGGGPASQPSPAAADRQRRAAQLYEQGNWHLVRGQYAVAAERFREALESDPDMLSALSDLAGICYLQKDYPNAITHYNEVLAKDGRHAAALRGAALAYVAQRQYSQSRDMLERLLGANAKDAEGWLDLGDVLFMMGDRVGALSRWNQAVNVDRSAPEIIAKAQRRLKLYGPGPTAAAVGGSEK